MGCRRHGAPELPILCLVLASAGMHQVVQPADGDANQEPEPAQCEAKQHHSKQQGKGFGAEGLYGAAQQPLPTAWCGFIQWESARRSAMSQPAEPLISVQSDMMAIADQRCVRFCERYLC